MLHTSAGMMLFWMPMPLDSMLAPTHACMSSLSQNVTALSTSLAWEHMRHWHSRCVVLTDMGQRLGCRRLKRPCWTPLLARVSVQAFRQHVTQS